MKKYLLCVLLAITSWVYANAQTVVTVSGDITSNTTWTNNNIYLLTGGFVYVTNNSTLTIQPGTLIKGNAASLVITRGSKLIADGTPTMPIVFTSYQPAGSRAAADWGGILILGRAVINDPAGERVAEGGIDPVKGLYGGGNAPNDDDSSGVLRYVRIEYAGIAYQPNNETNGLTMGGVGRKTVIDHVQSTLGGDDAFEWFGGTVNCKYLIADRTLDDDFDTDYGFRGKLQFLVSLSDSTIADVSKSNGFESDNDAGGTGNTPQTKPIFSNVTVIGPRITSTTQINSLFGSAAHIRRNSSLCTYNSVFAGFPTGLKIEGTLTGNNVTSTSLQFRNNIIAGTTTPLDSSGMSFGMASWFASNSNTTISSSTGIMLGSPYNYTNPDFVPQAGSPLLTGADFNSANINDPFFTPTAYRGAFGSTDWTDCWAEWNPNAQAYTTVPIDYTVPTPVITPNGPTTFCQGGSVTLIAAAAPNGATYLWSNGSTAQFITVNTPGVYTVNYISSRGCTSNTASVTVIVNALPTATATPSGATTFCQGGSVTLTASNAASYSWSTGATTSSITASNSGNYFVTVTDANGCSGTSSAVSVTVNALPSAGITAAGNTSFCTGDSVQLCANASSSYMWSTGATTQCIYASASGNYTVQVTDGNNCTSNPSSPVSVNVSSSPAPTINTAGPATVCQGDVVTLCASASDSYAWSNGATTQCITVNASGAYSVTVTNANACNGTGTSSPVTVTVNPQPAAAFTSSGTVPNITFTNTSSGAASYLWDFGDASLSTLQSPTHMYTTNGTYTVCLIATSAAGCADTMCSTVSINVGVEEVKPVSAVNLYPNPMTSEATLEFTLNEATDVAVIMTDLSGKVVAEVKASYGAGENSVKIDAASIPAGIYFTRMITANSAHTIKTIVIK